MRVPDSVQEAQEAILEIMKEYDSICRSNGIAYSLHGGTLLGAIRHKGFIPWDDDADVTMMRDQYEKLKECFNQQSKEFMMIESYLHMPRIIKKNLGKDEVFAWLDIMLYDPISENFLASKLKIYGVIMFQAMCRDNDTIRLSQGKNHGLIQMALFRMAYILGKPFSYELKYKWFNSFCKKCFCGKRTLIHRTNDQLRGIVIKVPSYCMTEYIDIPYEDTQFMSSKHYDVILRGCYGDNYMTPIRDEANDDMHVNFRNAFIKHLQKIEKNK